MPIGFEERRLEVETLLARGEGASARGHLLGLESSCEAMFYETSRVAELYTRAGQHAHALRCQRRASALAPQDPRVLYNLATALIAVGDLQEAERLLSRVITLDPHDCDAYYNRATLRQQTNAENHVDEILCELDRPGSPKAGEPALCYALSKELEDLGDYELSFTFLQRGASARRKRMSYRVEADEAAMQQIAESFGKSVLDRAPARKAPGPIFILGLPRSGTTLIDRILSSHSRVESLGEISDFALSMVRLLGNTPEKGELIRRAASMDFNALGDAYRSSTAGYERARPRFIDKTPINYLYLGLIRMALPEARVIHVRRNPMDSCFAMYRTLFRAGYPFSYDLGDLARYYVAYHRLMQHWRKVTPGAFIDVDYESLVANQELETRRMLEHCGLEFEPACLEFHKNEAPVATASAAQVRQPLYRSAVARWRRYEKELAPLAQMLGQAGIDVA